MSPRRNPPGSMDRIDEMAAQRIRAFRLANGWSLDALASRVAAAGCLMYPTTILRIEKGQRRILATDAVAFASVFGVPLTELLSEEEEDIERRALEIKAELLRGELERVEAQLTAGRDQ